MAIDDNTSYELTGAQVKDLANKIKAKANDDIFIGATSAAPGSRGIVPAPQAGDNTKYLRGDGTWAMNTYNGDNMTIMKGRSQDGWVFYAPEMTGATSSTDGTPGIVPAPEAGDDEKFLSGDGTWKAATEEIKFIATDWVGKGPFSEAYEAARLLGINGMYGNQSFTPRSQSMGSTLVLLSEDGSKPVPLGEVCDAFNSGKHVVINCAFQQFTTQSPEQCVRGTLLCAYAASSNAEEFTFQFTHPNLNNIVGIFSVQMTQATIGNDGKTYAVYAVRAQV